MNKKRYAVFVSVALMCMMSFVDTGKGLDDTNPPSIKNVEWSPSHPNEESSIRISATVTDESGVEWVKLFYCYGGNCYPPVDMHGSNDRYSIQIGPFNEGILEFHISAQDTVGNVGSTKEYSIFIDGTPPNIRLIYPNGGEYLSGIATIEWEVSDNKDSSPEIEIRYGNGERWYMIDKVSNKDEYNWNTSSIEDGDNYLIKITATDDAENSDYDISDSSFTVDNTPPQTIINISGEKNGDWFISNVSIILNANDNTSGVKLTRYRINENEWQNYTHTFEITDDGTYNITYYSIDNAGNEEDENTASFKINKNAPSITINKPKEGYLYLFGREISKTLFGRTIIIGEINIELTVIDETSGVERVEFYINNALKYTDNEPPYEWKFDERGFGNYEIRIFAYNNAGNYASKEIKFFALNL